MRLSSICECVLNVIDKEKSVTPSDVAWVPEDFVSGAFVQKCADMDMDMVVRFQQFHQRVVAIHLDRMSFLLTVARVV